LIRWGAGATEWWKDPFRKKLEDISYAGFEGLSLMSGHTGIFEKIRGVYGTVDEFLSDLEEKKLEWVSLYWYGKSLQDYKNQRYVVEEAKLLSEFISYCNCNLFVVDVMHQGVTFDYPVTDQKIRIFADCINKVGKETLKNGVRTVVHPHLNGLIENREQIDKFMEYSDPEYVCLCPDSGQNYLAGFSAADVIRTYGERIGLVHLKDAKAEFEVLDKRDWVHGKGWMIAKSRDDMFVWEKDRRYVDLGNGEVDLKDYVKALKEIKYDGWIIVEADGEGSMNPRESAVKNKRYVDGNLKKVLA